jgi:hypothetical protein
MPLITPAQYQSSSLSPPRRKRDTSAKLNQISARLRSLEVDILAAKHQQNLAFPDIPTFTPLGTVIAPSVAQVQAQSSAQKANGKATTIAGDYGTLDQIADGPTTYWRVGSVSPVTNLATMASLTVGSVSNSPTINYNTIALLSNTWLLIGNITVNINAATDVVILAVSGYTAIGVNNIVYHVEFGNNNTLPGVIGSSIIGGFSMTSDVNGWMSGFYELQNFTPGANAIYLFLYPVGHNVSVTGLFAGTDLSR